MVLIILYISLSIALLFQRSVPDGYTLVVDEVVVTQHGSSGCRLGMAILISVGTVSRVR